MALEVFRLTPETLTESAAPDERMVAQTWMARGDTDTDNVMVALAAAIPATYRGLYLQKYTPEHLGGGVWTVPVTYNPIAPLGTVGYQVSFKTGGGTARIEQSLAQVVRYGAVGVDPPDFEGLIGVNGDKVEGVEIVTPKIQVTVTKKFLATTLASNYCMTLCQLTGTVNNGDFTLSWLGQSITFTQGEALFLGASINDGGRDDDEAQLIEIVFDFEISFPTIDRTIGTITGINKAGWEYLWVRYEDNVSEDVHTKRPLSAHVERVYEEGDFSMLGI